MPLGGLFLLGMAVVLSGCQSSGPKPTAGVSASCTLSQPPAESGEIGSHGFEMRVFPRAKTMKSNFTGCQTIWWLAKNGDMQIFSRTVSSAVQSSSLHSSMTIPEGSRRGPASTLMDLSNQMTALAPHLKMPIDLRRRFPRAAWMK